jgi:quinol monooxygenase YgiN
MAFLDVGALPWMLPSLSDGCIKVMALVHSYQMIARTGSEDALAGALEALAEAVKDIAGSQGAMVLQDRKESQKFLFLEFWDDEASRKAAGSQLPKEVMGRIMAALGGPLQMADWDRLAVNRQDPQ